MKHAKLSNPVHLYLLSVYALTSFFFAPVYNVAFPVLVSFALLCGASADTSESHSK